MIDPFIIISSAYPALSANYIFIRGNEKINDFSVSIIKFESNEKRDEYFNDVLLSFERFINHFKNKDQINDNNIYEF